MESSAGSSEAIAVTDDRGKPIRALRIADLRRAEDDASNRRAALARHLRHAVKSESRRKTPGRIALLVVLIMGLMLLHTAVVATLNAPLWVGGLTFWGGVAAIIVLQRMFARALVQRQLAATAVAEGICGSCDYSLEALPQEEDGCAVCPECGAACRIARITRPHWAGGKLTYPEAPALTRFFRGVPKAKARLAPDDRGRFVPIVDSYLRCLPRSRRAQLGSERLRSLRRSLRRIGRIPRIAVAMIPLAAAGFFAYTAASLHDSSVTEAVAFVMLVIAIVMLSAVAGVLTGNTFYSYRKAARAMADEGHCASCARIIRDQAAADGLVTCPDCGAGWKLRAHPS